MRKHPDIDKLNVSEHNDNTVKEADEMSKKSTDNQADDMKETTLQSPIIIKLKEYHSLHTTKHIYKRLGALIAALIIGFTGMKLQAQNNQDSQSIQQGISQEIIRFHILANSDSEEDQALKLKVKDRIVDYMKDLLKDTSDIEETRQTIQSNLSQIEATARKIITQAGYNYNVAVALEETYFPVKTYGDCTFPAGEYQALRIKIGKAEGKNWWCVLYPNLCFIDATHAVVPDAQKQELQNILTEEEYKSITDEPTIKIKFKFLEDLFG